MSVQLQVELDFVADDLAEAEAWVAEYAPGCTLVSYSFNPGGPCPLLVLQGEAWALVAAVLVYCGGDAEQAKECMAYATIA